MSRFSTLLASVFVLVAALLIHHAQGQSSPSLRSPERLGATGWRLAWSAESGRAYRLERTSDLRDADTVWKAVTTVTATNGLVTAEDLTKAGSEARFYRVIAVQDSVPPVQFVLGTVTIRTEAATTNGTQVLLSGSLKVGQSQIAAPTPVTLDLVTHRLSGSGTATGSGGAILSGTFEADLDQGQLRFSNDPEAFALGDLLILDPRTLTLDLNTGSFSGAGSVSIRLPAAGGPAPNGPPVPFSNAVQLDGEFESFPPSDHIHFTGTAEYRGLSMQGSGDLQANAGTFSLTGQARIPGPDGTQFLLEPASVALSRAEDGSVSFGVEGQSGLTPAGVGRLSGSMNLNGAISLGWTGPLDLQGVRVATASVRLERPGTAGAVASLKLQVQLSLPATSPLSLGAELRTDGTLSALTSSDAIQFGALKLNPSGAPNLKLPVVTLTRSEGNRLQLRVQGEFLTPEASGAKPVTVDGVWVLIDTGTTPRIESLNLTNVVPLVQRPLPNGLKLNDASLRIHYTNSEFQARLAGSLVIAATTNRPITLNLDSTLSVNPQDPEDVGFDTLFGVSKLNLHDRVYLADAQFRVKVDSKPALASLKLLNGSAGFFPKFPATNPPVLLQRSDFTLFAGNVAASLQLSPLGASIALTSGSLQLPLLFTNLPAGLCPGDSSGTGIGLGPDTSVTVDIAGPHAEDLTVRATGSLNFTNITAFPQIRGFAAELCRASLVFNPGGLPYLTNLQGAVTFPFPEGQTNRVELVKGAWGLDGYPTGTVELVSNLRLFDDHGLKVTLLGRGEGKTECDRGMSLTVLRTTDSPLPTLIMTGATEVELPADLVTEVSGDRVRNVTCTTLTLPGREPLRPNLDIKSTRFAGTFHLGGANGLLVTNASLTVNNLDNLFAPTEAEPFLIQVAGTFAIPDGPAFTLKDAKVTLKAPGTAPAFTVAGVGYSENEFRLAQKLPIRISNATFLFKDQNKPLIDLFKPANHWCPKPVTKGKRVKG